MHNLDFKVSDDKNNIIFLLCWLGQQKSSNASLQKGKNPTTCVTKNPTTCVTKNPTTCVIKNPTTCVIKQSIGEALVILVLWGVPSTI